MVPELNPMMIAYLLVSALFALVGVAALLAVYRSRQLAFILSTACLLLLGGSSLVLLAGSFSTTLLSLFGLSPFSLLFSAGFALLLLLINLLAYANAKDYRLFSLLLCLVAFGALVVVLAVSLLELLLGLEMVVLLAAFLAILSGQRGAEPSVKLFIVGSLAAALLVQAVALVIPNRPDLSLGNAASPGSLVPYVLALPLLLFIAGLALEAGLFPFSLWVPDVYDGSPTHLTALLTGVTKAVAFVAILEVIFVLFAGNRALISGPFALLAVLTMFFGNILALRQVRVKRMFAYASVSQAGYIAMAIAAAGAAGLTAAIFYILMDALMLVAAFTLVLWLESNNLHKLNDYRSLYSRNSFGTAALTILMLSMIGIPPLVGFAGKYLVFTSAMASNMLLLVALGIVNSLIMVFYFGRLINSMFTAGRKEKVYMDWGTFIALAVPLFLIVLLGIYPAPLLHAASAAAGALGFR